MCSKKAIKVIILAGSRDFGRCPIASRLPTALWPVAGVSVLEHLLNSLANQGLEQFVICSNGDGSLLKDSIDVDNHLDVNFIGEQLPAGTAGAIRIAAGDQTNVLLLVFSSIIVNPPDINDLIEEHRRSKSDLTIFFNPGSVYGEQVGEAAGIYVCEPGVLEYIPSEGYFDVKQGLIPDLLRAGKTIHAAVLQTHAGNFRDWKGYLTAISDYLDEQTRLNTNLQVLKQSDSGIIWVGNETRIDPSARIFGPVALMDGACVSKGAVILGPSLIGRNVNIGESSVITNSVLWDGAQVGANCEIQRCVIDRYVAIRGNTIVEEKAVIFKSRGAIETSVSCVLGIMTNNKDKLCSSLKLLFGKIEKNLPNFVKPYKTKFVPYFAACVIFFAFLWSYWSGLFDLWSLWQRSDEYSSGLLVPFLVVYVLWSRRHDIAQCEIKPSVWLGLFAFAWAQAFRFFGLFFMYSSVERLSIALTIAALVLLLFGWKLFRKVSTVLLFMCLMLPWPNRIQAAVAIPLQRWATSSAVFCLEMFGYEIMREGNIIHIGSATVAVAEACNGLRMVTAFLVISGLVVLLIKRPLWEKLIILASSLPIALLCNTTRLTITAMAFTVLSGERWEKIFHDFGGYAMMPLALGLVVAELWLLAKLIAPPISRETIILTQSKH